MKRLSASLLFAVVTVASIALAPASPAGAGEQSCYQPDALIKRVNGSYLGGDIYNMTGKGQTKNRAIRPGHDDWFKVRIENDSPDCFDTLRVGLTDHTRGFKIRYSGGTLVNGFIEFGLASGEVGHMRIHVIVARSVDPGTTKRIEIPVFSTQDPSRQDEAVANVKVRRDAGDRNTTRPWGQTR